MTHFLVTDDNTDGHQLEDVLAMVRSDLVKRAALIADDDRQEARQVLANDIKIMAMFLFATLVALLPTLLMYYIWLLINVLWISILYVALNH